MILVTGAGRSGTSTVAGVINQLGFYVPQPVLEANASNPKGFFESTWPLWFHRRLMDAANMEQIDGRPEAAELIAETVTPEVHAELESWLRAEFASHEHIVVKDPRSAWLPDLWNDVGHRVGVDTGFVTMLRHPAEIVGSRATYYGKRNELRLEARPFAIVNLCGWINVNLVAERRTRSLPRVWVRYEDLLSDWRAAATRIRDGLDLPFDDRLLQGRPNAIDDFVDEGLRRHAPQWPEGEDALPPSLCEVAELVWNAGCLIARAPTGRDDEAEQMLAEARERYDHLYDDAVAIARDHTAARIRLARRRATRRARRETREQVEAELAGRTPLAVLRRKTGAALRRMRG